MSLTSIPETKDTSKMVGNTLNTRAERTKLIPLRGGEKGRVRGEREKVSGERKGGREGGRKGEREEGKRKWREEEERRERRGESHERVDTGTSV